MTTTLVLPPSPADRGRTPARVRPGTLVDVPGAARLSSDGGPGAAQGPTAGLDDGTRRSLLRMVLAHLALEQGGFWVADTDDGALTAVCALLPPRDPAGSARIDGALRLQLGLDVVARGTRAPTTIAAGRWVLLAPADDVPASTAAALVSRATAVLDAAGDPAVAPVTGAGGAASCLLDAGFTRSPVEGLLLRPARRHRHRLAGGGPRAGVARCSR